MPRSVTRSFYQSAAGVLLVFDLTNWSSFEHVPEWYHEAGGNQLPAFVLVGHKCDLVAERAVSAEEAGHLATTLGMAFVETSALSNLNVELAFQTLAGGIQQALGRGILAPQPGMRWHQALPQPESPPAPGREGAPAALPVLMGIGGRGTPNCGDASLSSQHLQPLGDYGAGSPTWA